MPAPATTTTDPASSAGGRAGPPSAPPLPRPRGPRSAALLAALVQAPHELAPLPDPLDDPVHGDDSALALYLCYELHFRGLAGVDERWEWEPSLLAQRARLEAAMEAQLRAEVPATDVAPEALVATLARVVADDESPSLSGFMAEHGTLEQLREFAIHRSAYQLKEADPHTFGLPRLSGRTKAAMVEIQADEYGGGVEDRMHSSLFAVTMRELGLDATYGAYVDRLPGTTLATVNLVTWLGLHRRLRGALVGHLALFEMCSVVPMGRYCTAMDRLGVSAAAREFYDIHVIADAHHEVVALHELAGGLAAEEPHLSGDVIWGARALQHVERRFAGHLLERFRAGRSSLLPDPA